MSKPFATVCLLSFNRPQFLPMCIENLKEAGEPFELILHDDGSTDPLVQDMVKDMLRSGAVSSVIQNPPGENQGVGEAVRKCFAAARGDVLIKVDQDLVFVPGWLTGVRRMLEDREVGAAGLFSYHHDPVDVSKTRILDVHPPEGFDHFYVTDFVGSAFAIPRDIYEEEGVGPIEAHSDAFAEDVALKERIRAAGYELALPNEALALNVGFGIGPSTVVVAEGTVQSIKHGPKLLDGEIAGVPA